MPRKNPSQTVVSIISDYVPDKTQNAIASIKAIISETEISEIDLKVLGNLLLILSKGLSYKVDKELLEPISKWLNDDEWTRKFNDQDDKKYNWMFYKRRQRQWTKQQKHLAAERLKLYRKEVTEKRLFREDARRFIGIPDRKKGIELTLENNFMEEIITPFCPLEHCRRKIRRQFFRAASGSVSDLLPWKVLIRCDLIESIQLPLEGLTTYCPENRRWDMVSKFIHLLELERSGDVELVQEKPFGDIMVRSDGFDVENNFFVTDQEGRDYQFDWTELTSKQRSRLIADIKHHKVLYKNGGEK